jgi:hypothetical protein
MKSALVLLSVLTLAAEAQPIVYNEATQGDIDGYGAPPTFQFDYGENVISGSTFANQSLGDSDAFGFVIPQGGMLAPGSIIFEYSNTNPYGDFRNIAVIFSLPATGGDGTWSKTTNLSVTYSGTPDYFHYIYSDGSDPYATTHLSLSPITLAFVDVVNNIPRPNLPTTLTAGLHWISNGASYSSNGTAGISWNYTLKMNVTPTPEPSSLALLALAAAGLASRRKRQARALLPKR